MAEKSDGGCRGFDCCASSHKWQELIDNHKRQSSSITSGSLPNSKAILWQPVGNASGGLAWEMRFLLLAFLTALASNRVLMLGWPFDKKVELPLSLPSSYIAGGYPARDKSPEAEQHRYMTQLSKQSALRHGAGYFKWREAECWELGLPYQVDTVSTHPHCQGLSTKPEWYDAFKDMLSGEGGLDPDLWMGCAWHSVAALNMTMVQELLPSSIIDSKSLMNVNNDGAEKKKTIAIHVRTGASDFGQSYEEDIRQLLFDSKPNKANKALSSRRNQLDISKPILPLRSLSDIMRDSGGELNLGENSKKPPLLPDLTSMKKPMLAPNFLEETKEHNLVTAVRSAKLALHCAEQLSRALIYQGVDSGNQDGDDSRSLVTWSIASDSPSVLEYLETAAFEIGRIAVWNRLNKTTGSVNLSSFVGNVKTDESGSVDRGTTKATDNQDSCSIPPPPLHHTKIKDVERQGLGELEASVELSLMGEESDAFIAAHSSIVRAGSAFAALSAAKSDVKLVYVVNGISDGSSLTCDWVGTGAKRRY